MSISDVVQKFWGQVKEVKQFITLGYAVGAELKKLISISFLSTQQQ